MASLIIKNAYTYTEINCNCIRGLVLFILTMVIIIVIVSVVIINNIISVVVIGMLVTVVIAVVV